MRNIILLLISLLFFLSLLVMVVTKGHTCFNKPPDSSCKFVKYEWRFVTTMIERVIIINLFSNAATTNQNSNMELFYENRFNSFRPLTTFALKLCLRCLIGSNCNTAICIFIYYFFGVKSVSEFSWRWRNKLIFKTHFLSFFVLSILGCRQIIFIICYP